VTEGLERSSQGERYCDREVRALIIREMYCDREVRALVTGTEDLKHNLAWDFPKFFLSLFPQQ